VQLSEQNKIQKSSNECEKNLIEA